MRRFVIAVGGSSFVVRLSCAFLIAAGLAFTTMQAQIPGRNVNMVAGQTWPDGDPFLQRQNEPSIAASTRNPLHLLAGSNDYRTIDLPGLPGGEETGDAWLGLYKSVDGGHRWKSNLLPGYPQDTSADGMSSPLKGYQAGADPVVRAGTSGLIFYGGLVFDRAENGKSAIFVSQFLDKNVQEAGDPFAYLGTTIVASSNGADGRFLDKPWIAVDMPRAGTLGKCDFLVPSRPPAPPTMQRVQAGNVYVVYTSITGNGPTLRSEIYIHTSQDCGRHWTRPLLVSRPTDRVNQGAMIAIDPTDGEVFVTWRRFGLAAGEHDGILTARLPHNAKWSDLPAWARTFDQKAWERDGEVFEHRERNLVDVAELEQFDQNTTSSRFRSNAYPTATVDNTGRLYVAWSERGFAQVRTDSLEGDARVMITTSMDGRTFTPIRRVDDTGQVGHQLMPTITFAGGRLMLVYYDVRETRAENFGQFVSDAGLSRRQTMDIRAAMGTPGDPPIFEPSVRVSDYLMGFRNESSALEQLQVNPPNLPMFKQGTVPFIGDYIDVTAAPAFIPVNKGWAYNHAASATPPVFHAVWTDNRDVRPPLNGDWTVYTPPTSAAVGPTSLADPTRTPPVCVPGNAGSRNQNVYSAQITGGLIVGSPGNSKPLNGEFQRAFVVFAHNTTFQTRSFRMVIAAQPESVRASFSQFPLPPYSHQTPPPLTVVDVRVPPRSMASRSVYATGERNAQIPVAVFEIAAPGASGPLPGGMSSHTVINPDFQNPDVENPDVENPDVENPDVENAEVYNPDVENPDVENPDVENPDVENPDVENPDVENVVVANPDIDNINIGNPDVENPDVENPDVENPDVENPDVENGAIADVTWNVTNTGNTTAAFNVNLFLSQASVPMGIQTQLVIYKTYKTPVTVPNGCELRFETRNVLVTNVPSPNFISPTGGSLPDPNDPSEKNPTLWLAPNETGKITLRIVDNDTSNNVLIRNAQGELVSIDPAFNPQENDVTPGISSQAVGTEDAAEGVIEPPIVTPTGSNLFFLQQPTDTLVNTNITPVVRVQARDNSGAVLPGVTVEISLATNPGDASLNGNVAVAGVDGIASFPALQVTNPGSNYILLASVTAGSTTATALSSSFNVTSAFSPTEVVNTNDSGPGSLRAAILYSNGNDGTQTITFNIPGTGPRVISPLTPLPSLDEAVIIDGRSQPGFGSVPIIGISGQLLPLDSNGLVIEDGADGSTIRGLVISAFDTADFSGGNAILVNANGNTILGNFIGTDMDGTDVGATLTYTGIKINASGANFIGGLNSGDRNVIAGNFQGIWMTNGDGTTILNNDIGFNRDSPVPIPAHFGAFGNQYGVLIDGGSDFEIGSIGGGGNYINGNITGIQLYAGANTQIHFNNIGVDTTGESGIPNSDGIATTGPVDHLTIQSNSISGNIGWGINIEENDDGHSTDLAIYSNTIGVDSEGQAFGNGLGGIRVISGENAVIGSESLGNLISGNSGPGIWIGGSTPLEFKPRILANTIGTSGNGGVAIPNTNEGVVLDGAAQVGASGQGNLISGNGNPGTGEGTGILVLPGGANSEIYANRLGHGNFGSPIPNGYSGITVYAASSVTIGGADGNGNQIGGNPHAGIALYANGSDPLPSDITIQGNTIGLNASLEGGFANGRYGISVNALDVHIGGDGLNDRNIIAGNGSASLHSAGIYVIGLSNSIEMRGNWISFNEGLGIDLDDPGVNTNDAGDVDSGTNGRQNFPVVSDAVNGVLATTRVDFDTTSFADGTYTLRFFSTPICDASGNGEGRELVGVINGISEGTIASMALTVVVPNGFQITATATNEDSLSTSEFLNCTNVHVP